MVIVWCSKIFMQLRSHFNENVSIRSNSSYPIITKFARKDFGTVSRGRVSLVQSSHLVRVETCKVEQVS